MTVMSAGGGGGGGDGTAAIEVRGAFKRYTSSAVVLRGLNMTVPEASIYGLLGPSGCGKTTLLKCIVGMTHIDAGHIFVKAAEKRNVGYMPQELGLYEYMTIMEIFHFYGKLYGLEKSYVHSRGRELVEFLDLPEANRLIRTLSGGQQRRLSFAVTLIHDPQLLILDEPTVGVDPILSAAIWERLLEMTTCQRKTIIITTHYIEEARQANTVGLMRDGVLLMEQPPLQLMVSQGSDTLEGAFLKLSERQEAAAQVQDVPYYESPKKIKPALVDSCPYWKTSRFMAQLDKNLRLMIKSYQATLLFLFMPPVIAYLCHVVLSGNPAHDQALGIVSPELTDGLETCKNLTRKGCNNYNQPFTCHFIDYLHKSNFRTIVYPELETAIAATRKNENWGVLSFSSNYTASALERMKELFSSSDDIIESSFVSTYMDMSDMWISKTIEKTLVEDMKKMVRGFLQECGINPKQMDIPVQFNPPVFGSQDPSFIEFFIPGVVCTFAFYLSIMYTTGAIMFEKNVGLERNIVAGMTKLEVVAAHCVVQLIIATLQQTFILSVFYYIYDYECRSGILIIFLLCIMLQIMGLFFGLVIGLSMKSERDATNVGIGSVNILFAVSGMTWPVEGMHTILRSVIWLFPVQPAVEAYRALVMRDWPLTHPVVYKGFLSTWTWTVIFLLATVVVARRNKTSL